MQDNSHVIFNLRDLELSNLVTVLSDLIIVKLSNNTNLCILWGYDIDDIVLVT